MSLSLVVGLGNPGGEYAATRHNLGFLIVDAYLAKCGLNSHKHGLWKQLLSKKLWQKKFSAKFLDLERVAPEVLKKIGIRYWLKPTTFMNRSGQSVGPCLHTLQLKPEQMLVVHDDLDIPLGKVKVKSSGGHGGHNGIRSIIDAVAGDGFWRLRIGIGKPAADFGGDGADWVLQPKDSEELQPCIAAGTQALTTIVQHGLEKAMQIIHTNTDKERDDVDG